MIIGLRRGMWVMHGERVGIVVEQNADSAEIHYVDGKGETVERRLVPVSALRQAKLAEIPAARIRATPAAVLKAFGYV